MLKWILRGISVCGLTASMAALSACGADEYASEDPSDQASDETVAQSEAALTSIILASVQQEDKIATGWMTSTVSLRKDGVVVGGTTLKTWDSVFGFTGQTFIVFLDADAQLVSYVDAGSWGINACFFSCPTTRTEMWSHHVSDWDVVKSDIHFIAIAHRHDPQYNALKWIEGHLDQIISSAKAIF